MQVHPVGPGALVQMARTAGSDWGIHVSRRLPERSVSQDLHLLNLPESAGFRTPVSLARTTLLLPMQYSRRLWQLPPAGVEDGVNRLWSQHRETGLQLPIEVLANRMFEEEWSSSFLATPETLGLPFPEEALADAAWSVLTRFRAEDIASISGRTALCLEVLGEERQLGVLASLNLQGKLGRRTEQAAQSGARFWHGPCLQWIVREAAAAAASGEWATRGTTRYPTDLDHEVVASILFPCLLTGALPNAREIARALWVLHQGYRFGDEAAPDDSSAVHDAILSMITALALTQPRWGAWIRKLDRWSRIYATQDTDPSVVGLRPNPSSINASFAAFSSLSISEWLSLAWFLALRFSIRVHRQQPLFGLSVDELMSESLEEPLDERFGKAVSKLMISDFADFGHSVLADNPSYSGLGSTSTQDSLASRNRPLLEVTPGNLVLLGLQTLVEHAVAQPRLVAGRDSALPNARAVNSTVGACFESYMLEVAARAGSRHRVLGPSEIDGVVPASEQRCDALIAKEEAYLLVECGFHVLNRQIMAGGISEIRTRSIRYHEKFDQAASTLNHLGAIADSYDLLDVRHSSIIVVTDVGLPTTPALFDELASQRPGRNPMFVVSVEDFEALIAAGEIWSIPGLVMGWQASGKRRSLGSYLWELSQLLPVPAPEWPQDTEGWLDRLGIKFAA